MHIIFRLSPASVFLRLRVFAGFVLMTPQLYINYKLKSVDHLPWRALIYRRVIHHETWVVF